MWPCHSVYRETARVERTISLLDFLTPPATISNTVQRYGLFIDKAYDPNAFAIALYALHAQGTTIPDDGNFENLLRLEVVCDDYECKLLQPRCYLGARSGYKNEDGSQYVIVAYPIPQESELK